MDLETVLKELKYQFNPEPTNIQINYVGYNIELYVDGVLYQVFIT